MLSKNNRKLQERKLQEKQRFGFRKYSFGLASALIGVSFMLGTGNTVSADTTTTTPAENVETATKNTDSGTPAGGTSSSDAAEAAAVSTPDTSATETNADSTATTPADNSTAETKTVTVDPEASNNPSAGTASEAAGTKIST
ncbi:MAG: YSIRK-type signal peptide-containing protein, partial [Lactobacillus equicursoris]|uniref:YSIRK-type signal peptide-containing protein n=1 Tax=Lactobacillus equicursoris TaxID=420645 RepID=UPI00242CDD2B